MCGITGFLDTKMLVEPERVLASMTAAIEHRGPDASGAWIDPETGVALGHRRLAIVDLSPTGVQPMASASGRFVIVFNGEIYNFEDLRSELSAKGATFRGHSDTEVILAAVEEWGLEASLKRFVGMFAFALWDRSDASLWLARDRTGEKPLYYAEFGSTFLFGSTVTAMREHPAFVPVVDRDALALYTQYGNVPAPYSIWRSVHKLPPSTFLRVKPGELASKPQAYWSAQQVARTANDATFAGSIEEALEALEGLLSQAVRQEMVADVPLGAFLSGGIDSSLVVAMMQKNSARPVKTFTIGFQEGEYDEAAFARRVAIHLNTDHTELYVTPSETLDVIPRLSKIYDEPFADASQIPTVLVAELARRQVTVALSGDGGDEAFGGYNRHLWGSAIWRRMKIAPPFARAGLAMALGTFSPNQWNAIYSRVNGLVPRRLRTRLPGEKLRKLANVLPANSQESLYRILVSQWSRPDALVIGGHTPPMEAFDELPGARLKTVEERMMLLDSLIYLPNDVLVKVDRATMAASLEARAPFLDHRVIEFAWTLPLDMKIRGGQGKWLLRQLLKNHVPTELFERPKMGFSVPIDSWLRGPLREWAENLLSEARLRSDAFFEPGPIRAAWSSHLSGRSNHQDELWTILMFQSWLENQKSPVFRN